MSETNSTKDAKLSACFPGLVAVCAAEDGQLLFLIRQDGQFSLQESAMVNGCEVIPPDRVDFPFLLPRAETVMKYLDHDDPNLFEDVVSYLKRFSALDEHQWAVVVHFVFLTYLHDHKDIYYCPILLFYAVAERGKSRTGKSVSYLSFRGIHLSELREANILRYCKHLKSTLFFDIMDIWKKAERTGCEDLLLGRFEKGQLSSRVLHPEKGPFREMSHFDIYGPTIIASNEPLHRILDTRSLSINMPNIPGNYENPFPASALALKARLTAWRGKHLYAQLPAMAPIQGISGRLWDISKSLFLVNSLLAEESQLLKEALLSIADERSELKQDSIEGHLVAIIREITAAEGLDRFVDWNIRTSAIVKRINEDRPADKQLTPQWVGRKLQSMSIRHRTVTGRSEILLTAREYMTLLDQYGFAGRDLLNPTESLPEKHQHLQVDTDVVGSSGVYAQVGGKPYAFNSVEERALYEFRVDRILREDGLPLERAEKIALKSVLEWRETNEVPF